MADLSDEIWAGNNKTTKKTKKIEPANKEFMKAEHAKLIESLKL